MLKERKKSIETCRFRTRVMIKAFSPFRSTIIEFIHVMLPRSALTENLLTQSLFKDTQIHGSGPQFLMLHINKDICNICTYCVY